MNNNYKLNESGQTLQYYSNDFYDMAIDRCEYLMKQMPYYENDRSKDPINQELKFLLNYIDWYENYQNIK
jgi:ribosome assembly protein YihI (activator of Der GTPase)